jgi:hypothetical protein
VDWMRVVQDRDQWLGTLTVRELILQLIRLAVEISTDVTLVIGLRPSLD